MSQKQQTQKIDIHGWLIIDKSSGPTSSQIVNKVKWLTKARKVGHAGTLDPLATGILPIALGEATKTSQYAMGAQKKYLFSVKFGEETDSLDADGNIIKENGRIPTEAEIIETILHFTGEIEQTPPAFSAIKINGQRAYKEARKGKEVNLEKRKVRIYSLKLIEKTTPDTYCFEVTCGKGTYVRALARDIAYKLGTYGHIVKLRRQKVGRFEEKNAISLEKLEELVHNGALFDALLPVEAALDDIPVVEIAAVSKEKIRNGQAVLMADQDDLEKVCARYDGKIIAIGTIKEKLFKPNRVFNY